MAELRENARCIFWSGALAFHGPKIIFLHDKNEELLVIQFMYICIPPKLWSSEIWQNSAYKRNTNIVYFTRLVTKERKFI